MIAVVDDPAERAIEVRAAAAACLLRRLVERHLPALPGQPDGGGETGEAGAHDVDQRHGDQRRPWRTATQSRMALLTRTGGSSCRQPPAISRSSVSR